MRVLRSSNISDDIFVQRDDDVFVKREAVNIECVNENDILITSANGSSRLVGKHAIVSSIKTNQAVHGGFMLLASTKEPYFINASMSSAWYKKFIELFVAGGNGSIGNLSKNDLDNYEIFIPVTNEQRKLGFLFRGIDYLITLHQRKLDALKKIKSALLEKMFPKDGSNVPEIRFTGFTEAWEQRKLGELFEYLSSQVQASQAQAEGKYKLFDASSQIGYSSIGSNRPLVTIIKDGSGVGRIRLIPYNSWFIGTLGGLLANETDVDFGYALLQNIDFSIYTIGSTIPHIYFKDYSAAPLLIAKIKEQQMIGEVFSKIDSLITLHQRKLK